MGRRKMLKHVDGRTFFGGSDEWTVRLPGGEVILVNDWSQRRTGEDAIWWLGD